MFLTEVKTKQNKTKLTTVISKESDKWINFNGKNTKNCDNFYSIEYLFCAGNLNTVPVRMQSASKLKPLR